MFLDQGSLLVIVTEIRDFKIQRRDGDRDKNVA